MPSVNSGHSTSHSNSNSSASMRRISAGLGCFLSPCHYPHPRRPLLRCCTALSSACRRSHAVTVLRQLSNDAASHATPTRASARPTITPHHSPTPSFVSFLSTSPSSTHSLAASLAAHSGPGDVLLLYGNVGEGKTELARGFVRAYVGMSDLIVTSPTYTVMLEYAHKGHRVQHIDLYRLDKPGDLALLPLQQMFKQDVSLVEWPERLTDVPTQALSVRLEKLAGETKRKRHYRVITLSANSEPWRTRIQQWHETGLPGVSIHKPTQ